MPNEIRNLDQSAAVVWANPVSTIRSLDQSLAIVWDAVAAGTGRPRAGTAPTLTMRLAHRPGYRLAGRDLAGGDK